MEVFKIKAIEDIAQIPIDQTIQLEIYLKNAEIPLNEINGNCFVRGVNCSFPNLQSVKGTLSIDAAGAIFSKLSYVEGNCNIHEADIQLPNLKEVKGDLVILKPVDLAKLELIGGRRVKNKAKVELKNAVRTIAEKPTYTIQSQKDIDALPKDGNFNLKVNMVDAVFPHTEILGGVQVTKNNGSFPNLQYVVSLAVSILDYQNNNAYISCPKLKIIQNNCHIYLDKVNLESLEIVGNRFQINKCEGIFPSLREIGTFFCLSSDVVVFPNLEIVKGNFKFSPPTKKTFTPTKKEESPSSKNLLNKALQWFSEESIKPVQEDKIELEEIIIKKKYNPANPFPKLKIIGGDANFDGESYFHSLETIKCLNRVWHSFEENYKVKLPSLKTVGTCVIDRNTESIFNIIKNPYFRLARTIFFSKKDFFIANSSSMSTHERLPLEKLIAIFKMRHSSFQSYIKREYERQTGLDYDVYEPLFRILEPKWEEVKPLTYKDIFTIKDWALRRFCFNYIGVSEMMKALEATRIATEGIELNYYRYDENGNKVPFKKHNIYEVYEANVNKIQELRTWRNNERKIYAVKCWCTSTNHEHWLWIEEQYRHDPLTAIASTFRIHENVIPFIKRLKRQGDILICELRDEVIPEGDVRPLTKREYFRLLEVET